MATTKAQQRAVTKYVKNKYDRLGLTIPKGDSDKIKAHAATRSESVNGFIKRAINQQIERDLSPHPSSAPTAPQQGPTVSLHPKTIKPALEAAGAAGEAVEDFIDRAVTTQAERDKMQRKMLDKG